MSEVTAALVGGLGGGLVGGLFALIGVLAGQLFERRLRTMGEVQCLLGGVRSNALMRAPNGMTFSPPDDLGELDTSGSDPRGTLQVQWTVQVRFYNEKDEPTGLHAVSAAFMDQDNKEALIGPLAAQGSLRLRYLAQQQGSPQDLVNLPSHEWVIQDIEGLVAGTNAVTSLRWKRIEVRAHFPTGKLYRREVPVLNEPLS